MRRLCPIPPTPSKRRALTREKRLTFNNPLSVKNANITNLFPNIEAIGTPFHNYSSYKVDDLPKRIVIEQAGKKDCGGAAAFMLLADVKAKYPRKAEFNKEFADWAARAYLYKGEHLVEGLSKALDSSLIQPIKGQVPRENPLTEIKNISKRSGFPVITGISHKQLGNHWIVVDHISETDVYIREPYTGKAYRVPREEMKKFYQRSLEEEIVYLKQVKQGSV